MELKLTQEENLIKKSNRETEKSIETETEKSIETETEKYLIETETETETKSETFGKSENSMKLTRAKNTAQFKTRTNTSVQFHSKFTDTNTQQKIGLKAFNLNGSAHLIARCPKYSVLIKLIFEKRNDQVLDVGFNCRRDYKNINDDEMHFQNKVESTSFDAVDTAVYA